MSIRVVIADDHPLVRDGLRRVIEGSAIGIEVVAEAADGLEVLKLAETARADIYILDITMPNLNGIDAARELLRRHTAAKVIILSLHDTKAMVEAALAAGALGYLVKDMASQTVIDAIAAVHAGRYYLCPAVAHFVVEASRMGNKGSGRRGVAPVALTAQERKVLQLIAEGRSNKEVAAVLELSINTVHAHRKRVMRKLDLHKQSDLVRYAIKAGIAKL